MINSAPSHWLASIIAAAAVLSGCNDPPVDPPKGDPAAFAAKAAAMEKASADPKFDDFRAACADYHATRNKVAALANKIAARTATTEESASQNQLEELIASERLELLAYLQQDRFTLQERNTMRWIMNAPPTSNE